MRFNLVPPLLVRFFLVCFFVCSATVFSQEQERDSLDTYSFQVLDKRFHKILYLNTNTAKVYAEKLLELAKHENDAKKKVIALINLASAYNVANESEQSFSYINRAISIAEKNLKGQELEAKANFLKGIFYYQKSNYEQAFEYYTKAYEFYKNSDNYVFFYSVSHNIALIKNILGDYKGALDILRYNYEEYINTPESIRTAKFGTSFYINTLLALNDTYIKVSTEDDQHKVQLLDSASFYNKIGYKEAKRVNNPTDISFHTQRGIISYERKQFTLALDELSQSIKKIEQSNHKSLFTNAYYYKAMSFKNLQQIDSAIVYFKKMDSISVKNDINYPMLQSGYFELAEIFKKRKDHANAYKYFSLYTENDRINERVTGTVRKDIHEKYDLVRLKEEIDKLNETRSNSLVIIGVLIACLSIFFIFHQRQKQKNKIAFNTLLKQLEEKKTPKIAIEKTKRPVTLDDEKVLQVLKSLEKFEEKEWFRTKNCDLTFVAKKAKMNKTYVSKIILEHKQLKFIDYIRNLRIDYALQRLKDDPVFRSYDIKSIAEESGFKSSDMFSRAFVKNTGIYPSYYIKNINKINSSDTI